MTSPDDSEKWIETHRTPSPAREETKKLSPEDTLQEGRYVLENQVGEGAFAVVYRARDTKLSRSVAVKVLRDEAAANKTIRQRFLREAKSVGQLSHPNVVSMYDVGEESGKMYLVMELVKGVNLQHFLHEEWGDLRTRVTLLEQASRGLGEAHRQKIVHRDIKPANILLTEERVPKIADFGIAQLRGTETLLTVKGEAMGTPSYMSPEQVSGESGDLGPETDVYALGMILYQMLTGKLAHAGNTPVELYNKIVEKDPVLPRKVNPDIPVDLETICLKALSKERQRRYEDANAFAEDLKRWLDGEPIEARPASWIYTVRRKVVKRKALVGAISGLAIVFATLLWVLAAQQGQKDARERAVKLVMEGNRLSTKADQWEEAITLYTRAIKLDPKYATAYNNRGLVRHKTGDYLGAIEDFTKAIELDPGFSEPHFNRGLSRKKAAETYGANFKDLAMSGTTLSSRDHDRDRDSIVLSTEGLNENSRGSGNDRAFDKAPPTPKKSGLEKAEEPGSPESEDENDLQEQKGVYTKGKVRKSKNSDTSQRGRVSSPTIIDTIIEDYSKAIELNPTFSLAYYERGLLYLERVDLDRAIADLRKALETAPPAWTDRRKAEAQLKQAEEWRRGQ